MEKSLREFNSVYLSTLEDYVYRRNKGEHYVQDNKANY